jgi:S-DNA-T family DNA segregation ATPase FtsK/SpoIIIE
MAKSDSSNRSKSDPPFQQVRERPDWLTAVICFLLGTLLLVAFGFYTPDQTSYFSTAPSGKANPVGTFGSTSALMTFWVLGVSGWLLPMALLWFCYLAMRRARRLAGTRFAALLVALVCGSGLATLAAPSLGFDVSDYFPNGIGGWIGKVLYGRLLKDSMGEFGAGLLLGTLYVASIVFILTVDIGAEFAKVAEWMRLRRKAKEERKAARAAAKLEAREAAAKSASAAKPAPPPTPAAPVGPTGNKPTFAKPVEDPLAKAGATRAPVEPKAAAAPEPKPAPAPKLAASPKAAPEAAKATPPPPKLELNIVKPEETKKAKATVPQSVDSDYQFPPLKLLKERVAPAENSDDEHRRNAENLLRILREFGVEVTLGEIHVGPVITRYELIPAAGVRVEKIAGLDKNIALGMRAQSVRILAPIPGKAAVGVEVPNQHPTPVGMREILESEDWAGAKSDIPIALGKDVSGKPLVSDLSKMPHLLIAGATGSGKSVCINSIVASILYSKSPKDLRLLMVDPKVVELKIFNSLPHMLIPVVTEPKKVPAALKWLLGEMEQRYQQFAKVNVRNITGFNSRKKTAEPAAPAQGSLTGVDPLAGDDLEIPERLPYIVAIVDELADLMMVAPAEIETSIARLAQLARAAGIHLIIATQRPSVNVITGVIKANLPSRIAFQVASQVDSRTILDGKGAETLIGRGDMLFSPPGTSRLVRAQGAFVSDEEVQGLVDFLKVNGPPVYANDVQAQIDRAAREDDPDAEGEGGGEDGELGDDEDLYRQALDVLKSTRRASTSMIQRRLRIGYNRAARIMDLMEEKGIVGPENGSSPREIIADLDKL